MLLIDRHTARQTNATENMTSYDMEVNVLELHLHVWFS